MLKLFCKKRCFDLMYMQYLFIPEKFLCCVLFSSYLQRTLGQPIRLSIWTKPVLGSIIEQMRAVYEDEYLARAKGVLAHDQVKKYTWKNSASELLRILRKLDYV